LSGRGADRGESQPSTQHPRSPLEGAQENELDVMRAFFVVTEFSCALSERNHAYR